jgi:hypothetical protein
MEKLIRKVGGLARSVSSLGLPPCAFLLIEADSFVRVIVDGVRAYWDGQTTLWSRTGKALSAPKDFLARECGDS